MSYCTQCGAQSSPGSKFCTKCGKTLTAEGQQQTASGPETETQEHPRHGLIKNCILAAIGIYAAGAVLVALAGFIVGALLGAGLCAILYFLAFQKLKNHDYEITKKTCLGVGIAAVVCLLINLGIDDMGGVAFNAIAGGILFYTYYLLAK